MLPKTGKIVRVALLCLLAVLVAATTFGLAYRWYHQHQVASVLRIDSPGSIDEGRFIDVRGTQQWISIRGHSRDNPVILFLHGGPGGANAPFADFLIPLEKEFTIVDWDQPGAGKTFRRAGGAIEPSLTIEQVAQDGLAVARFAREYLHKEKIVLLGASWGTIVGTHMAKAQPDLFYAYVGTAQAVDNPRNEAEAYARVLSKARTRQDHTAIEELEQTGPPPYRHARALGVQRDWAIRYEAGTLGRRAVLTRIFAARGYSLRDSVFYIRGYIASTEHFMGANLDGPLMSHDIESLGTRFALPLFVIQGAEDDITPAAHAKTYVAGVQAPDTQFVPIEGAGHDVLWTHTSRFLQELRTLLGPLSVR